VYLDKDEKIVDSWKGDLESKTVSEKGQMTRYVYERRGILALTNRRLIFIEEKGVISKSYHPMSSISLSLSQITAIGMGGILRKHVLITSSNNQEYLFHLKGIDDERSLEVLLRRKIDLFKGANRVPYQEGQTKCTSLIKEPQTTIQPANSKPTIKRNELSQFDVSNKEGSTPAQSVYGKMTGAERLVAKFLTENDLWWEFHQPVSIHDEADLARIYYPDFYVPRLSVYVEVCGAERAEYERRRMVYEKNKIPIVFVQTYKDGDKWKKYLLKRLKEIHESRWEKVRDLP
jgi:hypothetical protein